MSVFDHLPIIEAIAKRLDFKYWGNLCLVSRKCARCFRESEWIQRVINQVLFVRKEYSNLSKIENQEEQACIESIRKWNNFRFVKNPNETIDMEIIKEDPYHLSFVKQTEKICIEAVKSDGMILMLVKEQTLNICKEAYNQNKNCFMHICKKFKSKILLEEISPKMSN